MTMNMSVLAAVSACRVTANAWTEVLRRLAASAVLIC